MIEKVIYDNGSSKCLIRYDGEIINIIQVIEGEDAHHIHLYKEELEDCYQFILENKGLEEG